MTVAKATGVLAFSLALVLWGACNTLVLSIMVSDTTFAEFFAAPTAAEVIVTATSLPMALLGVLLMWVPTLVDNIKERGARTRVEPLTEVER